jgi:two-component system chemotaxis response regulator CheB
MVAEQYKDQIIVRILAPSKDDKYIPSVNAMLASVARVYGHRALAVVLTGMGNDGSQGVVKIKDAGGGVLAESEESAVVFGMPREAIAKGVVDKIVPLEKMAGAIMDCCGFLSGKV